MQPIHADPTVLVLRCEQYDRDTIERLVIRGAADLGVRLAGRTFVKPNVVFAGTPDVFGTDAVTHPALLGGVLQALTGWDGISRVDVGENSAIGFPTRHCYENAGYYDEVARAAKTARAPLGIFCMDEERRDEIFVGGRIHTSLRLARTMARADTKVYLPKLKCHCVSSITCAVKLNIGICSDDERSTHHDYLLDEKIVDLLSVGYPDLIVVDAIDVGLGNEAFPHLRRLGLVLMSKNPVAVDLVGARLLGFELGEVPYLKLAVERGYRPGSLDDVPLAGDVTSVAELDDCARRLGPRDASFTAWHDVSAELERLGSPMRLCWGPYRGGSGRCHTGCIMGLKMFLAAYEKYAGPEVFQRARPVVFVVGQSGETIDANGAEVFLLGSCARAEVANAERVTHIDKCFVTASDMTLSIGHRLGMPSPLLNPRLGLGLAGSMARAAVEKAVGLRYAQDVGHFLRKQLMRRI